jgi:lipoprotein-anchoring transpeptidase ErfK/SrfK
VVAHLDSNIPGYPSADAIEKNRTVPATWYGYPSALPVVAQSHNRLKVRLAQRPDETETWIDKSKAVLTVTHWAIVVDIPQHWLYVFRYGQQVESFPVGDGAPGTPTPTGTYFVAFHAPPNGPGYGSVMLETSAHSRVIAHFEGGNDAIIAIHGPVGSDAEIGTRGASISNGCIRMHEWDLRQVASVINGSPVYLTD